MQHDDRTTGARHGQQIAQAIIRRWCGRKPPGIGQRTEHAQKSLCEKLCFSSGHGFSRAATP